MKLIIGLGNPGQKFNNTPHNLGFEIIDLLKERGCFTVWQEKKKLKAKIAKGENVVIAKPETFMNQSGLAVKSLMDYYKISSEDILVIQDDITLDAGKLRIKKDSTFGGHKGIKSIIENIKTKKFKRLKIGIGPKPVEISGKEYVLKKISKEKTKILSAVKEKAVEILEYELNNS
jgi:peptidyl-tRNA hydrolase, PTH1 family